MTNKTRGTAVAAQQNTQPSISHDQSFSLIASAIEKGQASIEVIERLVDLQDRQQAKKARADFYDAMSSFQSYLPLIRKQGEASFQTRNGGNMSYSFARLEDIDAAIRPELVNHGLSYRYETKSEQGRIEVTCIVTHRSGHSERATMASVADQSGNKNAIQQVGSTITYLQRYTLVAAFGLTTADSDRDGVEPEPQQPSDDGSEFLKILPDMIEQLYQKKRTPKELSDFIEKKTGVLLNGFQVLLLEKIESIFTTKQGE